MKWYLFGFGIAMILSGVLSMDWIIVVIGICLGGSVIIWEKVKPEHAPPDGLITAVDANKWVLENIRSIELQEE